MKSIKFALVENMTDFQAIVEPVKTSKSFYQEIIITLYGYYKQLYTLEIEYSMENGTTKYSLGLNSFTSVTDLYSHFETLMTGGI